jgi:regulator of RNase E activity RraA
MKIRFILFDSIAEPSEAVSLDKHRGCPSSSCAILLKSLCLSRSKARMRIITNFFFVGAAAIALAQTQPDPSLRYSRNTYSPVVETLKPTMGTVTDGELEHLKHIQLEPIWQAVIALGYTNCHFSGLKSTRPNERLVGRALTIRYLPRRPDLVHAMEQLAKEGDWSSKYNVRAAEEVKKGEVIVVDLGGGIPDGIFFGDASAIGSRASGANGVILYGSTRDKEELEKMENFPVLAIGFDPRPASQIGVDWNVPIRVGGATVLPGDVVVADSEAAVFFPPSIAAEVIRLAQATQDQEMYERKLAIERQHRFRDVYPLNPELKKKYEEEKVKQK